MYRLFLLLLLFASAIVRAQNLRPDDATMHVNIRIASDYEYFNQWIYLFGFEPDQNEVLYDSCYLQRGDETYILRVRPRHVSKEIYDFTLVFEKKQPKFLQFHMYMTEDISIEIDRNTKTGLAFATGSFETALSFEIRRRAQQAYRRSQMLQRSLEKTDPDTPAATILRDSIARLDRWIKTDLNMDHFNRTKSSKICIAIIEAMKFTADLPQAAIDSLTRVMKMRFPDDEEVRSYPTIRKNILNEQSYRNGQRKLKLLHKK